MSCSGRHRECKRDSFAGASLPVTTEVRRSVGQRTGRSPGHRLPEESAAIGQESERALGRLGMSAKGVGGSKVHSNVRHAGEKER